MAHAPAMAPGVQGIAGPESLMQLAMSYMPGRVLTTAVQLDIFSTIYDCEQLNSEEISRRINASNRGITMLLDCLVALTLLQKSGTNYQLTPLSRQFLAKQSPDYLGYIYEDDTQWHAWGQMAHSVKSGQPYQAVDMEEIATSFFPKLVRSLHVMHREQGRRLAQALLKDSSQDNIQVLDVACGSGVWGIAFAEASPKVHVTALDFPKVLDLTREYLDRHDVANQYDFLPGDLKVVDFPAERYDFVILGHIVHSEGEPASRELFKRLHQTLKPGGKLIVIDMIPNDDRTGPPFALMFALHMLVNTQYGSTYTLKEYTQWLHETGYGQIQTVDIASHSPVIIATRN